jgi:phosphoribulokinase
MEHFTYTMRHPRLGVLRFYAWRTRPTLDERFVVVHFTPVDGPTALTFERLARMKHTSYRCLRKIL